MLPVPRVRNLLLRDPKMQAKISSRLRLFNDIVVIDCGLQRTVFKSVEKNLTYSHAVGQQVITLISVFRIFILFAQHVHWPTSFF